MNGKKVLFKQTLSVISCRQLKHNFKHYPNNKFACSEKNMKIEYEAVKTRFLCTGTSFPQSCRYHFIPELTMAEFRLTHISLIGTLR